VNTMESDALTTKSLFKKYRVGASYDHHTIIFKLKMFVRLCDTEVDSQNDVKTLPLSIVVLWRLLSNNCHW
jgi:hypothetical protein